METSDILNKITKVKRSQQTLIDYVTAQNQIVGNKVRYCGTWLQFREWLLHNETRLLNANFCKKWALCQACAVRRAARMNQAYLPKVEKIVDENPSLIPAMVTLTIKNGSDLEERLNHFKSTWKKMGAAKRKGASSSSRNGLVEWNKVVGSIRAIETTVSKKREWHVHAHCFVMLSDYIDREKLSEEWLGWSGDSKIVHVTKCDKGIKSGLVETLKYITKFSKLTAAETYHVHEIFAGSRCIDPQGILRGVPAVDIDNDEIEPELDGPYRDFIAQWLWDEMRFELVQRPEKLIYDRPSKPTEIPF